MPKSIEKLLVWTIRICIIGIILIPLLVVKSTLFPFIFSKILLFRTLVEISFLAWLPLVLWKKEYRPSFKDPIIFWLTVFQGILVVTMLIGVDPERSLWSTVERMTGVVTFLHFWIWLLIVPTIVRNVTQWKYFLSISLAASLIVGVSDIYDGATLYSTLGNPIYVGVYALLHIFFAFFLLFLEKKRYLRIVFLFLALFNIAIAYVAGTRGSIVALFAALLCLWLYVFLFGSKAYRKPLRIISVCIMASLVVGALFIATPSGKDWVDRNLPGTFHRLFYEGLGDRIGIWYIGIQGFFDRPLTGWGWENYYQIYDRYYKPVMSGVSMRDPFIDRSHNQFIDVLALTGIFGFIAYGMVWVSLIWCFLRILAVLRRKQFESRGYAREEGAVLSLLLFFIAYNTQNITIFDHPSSLILLYIALALTSTVLSHYRASNLLTTPSLIPPFSTGLNIRTITIPKGAVIVCSIMLAGFLFYNANYIPFQQTKLAVRAINSVRGGADPDISLFKETLKKKTFARQEIRSFFADAIGQVVGNASLSKDIRTSFLAFIERELFAGEQENPQSVRYFLKHSYIKRAGYTYTSDPSYLAAAEKFTEKARRLSPERLMVYYELAEIKGLQNDLSGAIQVAKTAVDKSPGFADSHFILSFQYLRAGKWEEFFREVDTLERLGYAAMYSDSTFINTLVNALPNGKRFETAGRFIETVVEKRPGDVDALIYRILIYKKMNDNQKVKEYLQELNSFDIKAANLAVELLQKISK